MSKRSFGHECGVKCPHCKTGVLLVQTKRHDPNGDCMDGGSFFPVQTLVVELFCSQCFGKFVALDEGKDIRDILEKQLETFALPYTASDVEPKTCSECGSEKIQSTHSKHWSDQHSRTSADPDIEHEDKRYIFKYCEDCLTVVYIIRHPKPPEKRRVFGLSPIDDCEIDKL